MNYKIILERQKNSREFKQVPIDSFECNTHSIRVVPTYLGICGSDLYHYSNDSEDNICFGHEWIGRVTEVGSSVSHVKMGDVVTTSSTLGCGDCVECRKTNVNYCLNPIHLGSPLMGALMGEMVFNAFNARVLNSQSNSEVLIEVMAVACEALRLMKEQTSLENKRILVMGAGTVGILIAYLLKLEGFEPQIIDPHANRIETAKKLNLKAALLKPFIIMGEKNSFDIIFDATSDRGSETGGMSYWPQLASLHHSILVVGKYLKPVNLNVTTLSKLGGNIKFMRGVPLKTMDETISKWSDKLNEISKVVITHEYLASEIQSAFETALNNSVSGKVIVRVNG